jgi:hypothetical protein
MKKIFASCFFFAFVFAARSQAVRTPTAVYAQLTAYSGVQGNAFSITANQAALAGATKFSAGMYGEKRFMLQDLGLYKIAVVQPTSTGNFGFQAGYFGGGLYNQSQLSLAYGRKLGKVDLGAQFNWYQFKAAGSDGATAVNFEGGIILHLTGQLQAGIHIYNPTAATIGKNMDEKLPVVYSAGFGYDASESFFISAEFEKTEDQAVNLNAALQYVFDKKLLAGMGISSATSTFYAGFGFLWKGLRVDATASLHPQLGLTPGLLLIYTSNGKN